MQIDKLCDSLKKFQLPDWDKLPELELYLDQILLYIEKTVPTLTDTPALTRSMINNYVKLKLVDIPVKKKYSKESLAQLLMIRQLKQVSSIETMRRLLHPDNGMTTKEIYMEFLETQKQCGDDLPLQATPLQFALKSAAYLALCNMMMNQNDDRENTETYKLPKLHKKNKLLKSDSES